MRIKWENMVVLIGLIIALVSAKAILGAIRSVFLWFSESLEGMNTFAPGARAAIAILFIVLVLVMVFKLIQK